MTVTNAQKVREFHEAVGAAMPPAPRIPSATVLQLRERLLDEEFSEMKEVLARLQAIAGQPQREEGADQLAAFVHELTDLLYVTYGAILACGVQPDAIFAEVHRANMEKRSGPRRPDGKQLKPPGWQPANVLGMIREQQNEHK